MTVISVETISVILKGRQCDLFSNITVIRENNLIPASTKCLALFQVFFFQQQPQLWMLPRSLPKQ